MGTANVVDSGEEVVIVRHGKPVARLVRVTPRPGERQRGRLRGQFEIGEDFYAPDPAIEALFNS